MEQPNTSNGASVTPASNPILKGTLVFVFMALLGLIAVASIVLALVEVATDGHRRIEDRKLVRIF